MDMDIAMAEAETLQMKYYQKPVNFCASKWVFTSY